MFKEVTPGVELACHNIKISYSATVFPPPYYWDNKIPNMASRAKSVERPSYPTSADYCLLVDRLLQKDTLLPPKTYKTGHNINNHIKTVERYLATVHIVKSDSKAASLINSLDEDIQVELFSQAEFEAHDSDFDWIKSKLLSLYQPKSSQISPLIHLFAIAQREGQTVDEYAKQLRVEAYRRWDIKTCPMLEDYLIRAFLHGILERNVALAVEAAHPSSIEIAAQAVKKEQKYFGEPNQGDTRGTPLRQIKEDKISLQSLFDQITKLQKHILHLEEIIKIHNWKTDPAGATRRPPLNAQPQRTATDRNNSTCYLCKRTGHWARNCPNRRKCYLCGSWNHIARSCPKNRDKSHLRQIEPAFSTTSLTSNVSGVDDQINETFEENGDADKCFTLRNQTPPKRSNNNVIGKNRNVISSFSAAENKIAKEWTDYIVGRRPRPKTPKPSKTLISESKSESARNKPLIIGKCAGIKAKLFLDSGAEMNVMDEKFLNSLLQKQLSIKFSPTTSKIQCANGSHMTVTGSASVCLEIGNAKSNQKFMIVKEVFPRVIVGIKAMKTMGIMIDPASDSVLVDGRVRIPFISHVEPQNSVMQSETGKEEGLFNGAKRSPSY